MFPDIMNILTDIHISQFVNFSLDITITIIRHDSVSVMSYGTWWHEGYDYKFAIDNFTFELKEKTETEWQKKDMTRIT